MDERDPGNVHGATKDIGGTAKRSNCHAAIRHARVTVAVYCAHCWIVVQEVKAARHFCEAFILARHSKRHEHRSQYPTQKSELP
ncbi:hypothetical protein [Cupriavidus taiwanensis]|uniref:hypothetical protein n=1 Tax=Cupriavidus taiwanensis TaxID=164546 RepID=UPI0011C03DF7|nr:hypothetical protein [Cupriavidus taiwanensis]